MMLYPGSFNVLNFAAGRDDRHADHPGGIIVNPMPETAALATVPGRFAFDTRTDAWGYLSCGVLALGASLSFAAARAGVINGLTPGNLIPMWFGVAGIVLYPAHRTGAWRRMWLQARGLPTLAAIGRRRGLVLTGRGGPPATTDFLPRRCLKWVETSPLLQQTGPPNSLVFLGSAERGRFFVPA
jgi:hypothetical protein